MSMGKHHKPVVIRYVTEEELKEKINKIEKEYPKLPEIAAESCCRSCAARHVADEYGWDVANKEFEDWDEAQWLLTGNTSYYHDK